MKQHHLSMLCLSLIAVTSLTALPAYSQYAPDSRYIPDENYQPQPQQPPAPEYKYQSESYDEWNNMTPQQRDEYREQLVQERLKGMPRGEQQRYYRERNNAERRLFQGSEEVQDQYIPLPPSGDPARGMSF